MQLYREWSGLRLEIAKYCKENHIFEKDFRFLGMYEWMKSLSEIVKCEKVYLLLEEDNQHIKYWVAECSPFIVPLIINEAIEATDYYITDKKFHWLITENHHDVVQFIGTGLDADIIKSVCSK